MARDPELQQFMRTLGKQMDAAKRALVFDLDRRLVQATPVLTGRAQNGWNVSRHDPDLSVPDVPPPGTRLPPPPPPKISPSRDPNTDYYVTNNVEYIEPLNNGHSQKAPAGFVEASVAATEEFGDTIIRGVVR